MKLRTARKIWKAAGTLRELAYTAGQLELAYRRTARTRTGRKLRDFASNLRRICGVARAVGLLPPTEDGRVGKQRQRAVT